jgi:hypothetical protein
MPLRDAGGGGKLDLRAPAPSPRQSQQRAERDRFFAATGGLLTPPWRWP